MISDEVKKIVLALYFFKNGEGVTVHDIAEITDTSVASLYRWLKDVDRTQLAQSHLDIAFAADQIEPEPEPAAGGERKKDKRRQRQ